MQKWTKTAGLFFLAATSVYSFHAEGASADSPLGLSGSKRAGKAATAAAVTAGASSGSATLNNDVRVLDEVTDPFSTTKPSSDNADGKAAASKDIPVETLQGQSVSASQVNVSDAGIVEIHVNDANLVEVLRMLSIQSQKNIIATKEVKGTITANLYDVTVREALDAILHANGYAYREKGNFIYVYTVKELAEIEKANRVTATQVFHLYYTPAANAVNMLKPVLSSEAQVSFSTASPGGLKSGTDDTGGSTHATEDFIVVTDYQDNLNRVKDILKEIDRRPQQILVEATILRASLTENNALGVDFNVLGGVDFSTFTHASGQISNGNLATSGAGTGTTGTNGGTADLGNYAVSGGTGNSFTNTIPNGLKVGIVTNSFSVFLSALESITDTTVLANPKILALNKQKGEVIVGRRDGYITTTTTDTSTVQTVEFLDTGTRLIFRPYIGDDGYIRMEIHPEDSSGGLTAAPANLPFKITTEVTSNVMVKDGHTIVIGGLFRESSSTSKAQYPFLGNLPLAGALFRQQSDQTTREEIIILLTPHIVKDDAAYSEASQEVMKEAEKLRVGVRQGMMPWGRERLAESSYEAALAEMNKPHPDEQKALWHLNCATNLNPKFLEAIDLKQKISGQEIRSVDNSSIRTFVREQILEEGARNPAVDGNEVPTRRATTMPAQTGRIAEPIAPVGVPAPTSQPMVVVSGPATRPVAVDKPAAMPTPTSRPGSFTTASIDADDLIDVPHMAAEADEER